MCKPHKHAAIIKAWADGAIIQVWSNVNGWKDVPGNLPLWSVNCEYRVKPEPKPDIIRYGETKTYGTYNWDSNKVSCHNIRAIFDGETGKLKAVELI